MVFWDNEYGLSDDDKTDLLLSQIQLEYDLRCASKEANNQKLWDKSCEYVCLHLQCLTSKDKESAINITLNDPEWWARFIIRWTKIILKYHEDIDKVSKLLNKATREYNIKINTVG